MADPKGTYNSPSATGLATVLPAGPNFLGFAMSREALQAKRAKAEQDAKDRADRERDKAVDRAYSLLSKPVPSDQMYQEQVDRMKADALDGLSKMDLEGADPAQMRRFAAEQVQDIISYSTAGKQLAQAVGSLSKAQSGSKYKVIKMDDLQRDITSQVLLDENGVPRDSRKVDGREISIDSWLYEKPGGIKYIDPGQAIQAFVNSESMKEASTEIEMQLKERRAGKFAVSGSETTTWSGKPFLDYDPVTGEAKVKDAEALVDNGILQVALNDRPMALLINARTDEFFEREGTEPSDEERNAVMGEVLKDLLNGSTGGSDYRKKLDERFRRVVPMSTGSGGGGVSAKKQQEFLGGAMRWNRDAMSQDVKKIDEAFTFASKKNGISMDSGSTIEELSGAPEGFEYQGVSLTNPKRIGPEGFKALMAGDFGKWPLMNENSKEGDVVWARFSDGHNDEWIPIDRTILDSELATGSIMQLQGRLKYPYKSDGRKDGAAQEDDGPTTDGLYDTN